MGLQVIVDFQVIDESDDWIVVNKPAPLIVHPANRKPEPTLLGGLENLLSFELETGGCLGIVTRLDRETSGVVLVAKHTAAARELGMIFERREARKQYLAVVLGWPELDEWRCCERIIRAGEIGHSEIWVRQVTDARGKECKTRFTVERRFERAEGKFSVVRCFPETGRMHQIRVHLAHSGHPIVGDKLYSGSGEEYIEWMETGWTSALERRLYLPRQALHASCLEVPSGDGYLRWEADLSPDLLDFIEGRPLKEAAGVVIWSRRD